MTVLSHLASTIRSAATYNRHDLAAPRVILWTDAERLWSRVIHLVKDALPELHVLDETVEDRSGPATVLRYRLGRQQHKEIPVFYLPGIARSAFRGAAGFPVSVRHLFPLQYQGQFWSQTNGKDWTPFAFLTAADAGLMLEVGKDGGTKDAIADQLDNLLRTPIAELRGRRIEAEDLHKLVTSDPIRSLLQWVSDPEATKRGWKSAEWKGFVAIAKSQFGLDHDKDSALDAAERLVEAQTKAWADAWKRFDEAPSSYAGVREQLLRVKPGGLFSSNSERLPQVNAAKEGELRAALKQLHDVPHNVALERLIALCLEHAPRMKWIWTKLGESPLAEAAFHLGAMASLIKTGLKGDSWESFAASYASSVWVIDASAWKALALARDAENGDAVKVALRAVYQPWIEKSAERLQALTEPYPSIDTESAWSFKPEAGTAILFVDGLRFDVGRELEMLLQRHAFEVDLQSRWTALPTVTATAKPAWAPLCKRLNGSEISAGFEPTSTASGKPLKATEFRALLRELGWRWIEPAEVGDPNQPGWAEAGAFDRYGHDDGARLAWRIDEEVRAIFQRIRELLKSGWKSVRVITDHGWLLMPGGLPKVQLPQHLTESRWGRSAVPGIGASHGFRQTPWFWGNEHSVVLAPGVSAFKSGTEYTHGGLTLQEALTPVLTVRMSAAAARAVSIESVRWIGLRLQVQLSGGYSDTMVDLRTKAGDGASSILRSEQRGKRADEQGKLSLAVENDDLIGSAAIVVVLSGTEVVAKQPVTVGGD